MPRVTWLQDGLPRRHPLADQLSSSTHVQLWHRATQVRALAVLRAVGARYSCWGDLATQARRVRRGSAESSTQFSCGHRATEVSALAVLRAVGSQYSCCGDLATQSRRLRR